MKRWQFWVGIVISVIFLYIALKGLDLPQVWEVVQSADYWWILPGVGVFMIGMGVRAWRWHYLLRPLKPIPTRTMFPIMTIGYMGNNIFPYRAGEVLRAAVLRHREAVPISASFATIIVERIFDGVVMLGFIFLNLPQLGRLTQSAGFLGELNIYQISILGAVIFIGALAVFLAAAMFPAVTERIVNQVIDRFLPVRFRDRVRPLVLRFLSGLESLASPKEALMIFFTTVIIWLLETAKYWFIMHAFPFEVSFYALMLMNGIVNIATTIPSAPGYIGTFDAPGIAVLAAFGVQPEVAAGYTLLLHAALWLPVTALGAYYYLRQPLRWGQKVADIQSEPSTEALSD